ncbi:MAG TPA: MaoC family dehydratase [Candidatus Corynebacterium avicola]|uniref:MaoC family dehydratase n=1 Tax=Candidatus Corynebacterium avicola TaxID=2838527 RepID=A0A9D1RQZ1_9CORY|nr:MaoC family dehydratase [Candidatus Corynebacterium avicola]
MTTRTFTSIEQLQAATGEALGTSAWRTVTQSQVDQFADATDDHQWVHVDVDRAADGPFGGTIAHGFLTLSLLSAMAAEVYTVEGMSMVVNYGLNKVRFPSPVRVGSSIRTAIELVSVEPSVPGHLLTARAVVEIEGESRPACVAEMLALLVA